MTDIVLFHHVRGLTEGITAFADALREAGHTVHVADLFDSQQLDSVDDGLAFVSDLGFETVLERGVEFAQPLPTDVVYMGFSLGVLPAQLLLQTRPGAKGALLFHSFVAPNELAGAWPDGTPAQIHAMDQDPFFVDEGDQAAAMSAASKYQAIEIFLYPGADHLFLEPDSSGYDPEIVEQVKERCLNFLAALPSD